MAIDDEIIQMMLNASPSGQQASMTDVDTTEYDWAVPHHFTSSRIRNLEAFAQKICETLARALSDVLRVETSFQTGLAREQYAGSLKSQTQDNKAYYLAFSTQDDRKCGYFSVAALEAVSWIANLLGGGGGGGDREMSALEVSLLDDVAGSLVSEFCKTFASAGGQDIEAGKNVSTEPEDMLGGDDEEYFRITFRRANEGDEQESGQQGDDILSLVLASDVIETTLDSRESKAEKTPAQQLKDMEAHVGRVVMEASVLLGTATASIRDMAALEVGDVLILDKRVNEPVELLVQGKSVSAGLPATCDGQYAIQVTG